MAEQTIRDQVLDAVVALLQEDTGDTPSHLEAVHRFRFRPIDRDKLSALAVYPFSNDEGDSEQEAREDVFVFVVECRAKQIDARSPDTIADELYHWTVTQLLADPTLEGLVTEVEEGSTQWQGEELTELYAACAVQFVATFNRQYADPATAA